MGVGERLKAERERLGYTQTQFAACAGASKHAQINWEKEVAAPNATALAAWAEIGLDVSFVVTGERLCEPSFPLTPEEVVMLEYFRAASGDVRKAALGALIGATVPEKRKVRQLFLGNVGQAIEGDVDQRGATIGVFGKKKK